MRNETNIRHIDTTQVETLLKNETYRYQLALKDGAVNSIIKEVVNRITELETELKIRSTRLLENG